MRHWILIAVSFAVTWSLPAQEISLGIIGGARVSTLELQQSITHNGNTYQVHAGDLAYNPTGGAFVKLKLGGLYFQPEVHYATSTAYVQAASNSEHYLHTLTVQRIDLPMQAGLEFFRFLRVYGGLNASLIQADNWTYNEPFWSSIRLRNQATTWSSITGVGLTLGRFTLDARYERQLGQLYFDSSIDGMAYQFAGQQEAIVALLGFHLFK